MPISTDWSQTLAQLPHPVPAEWLLTRGQGVKVALIDSGVNLGLKSLRHLDQAGRKFNTGTSTFSVAKLTGQDLIGEAFGMEGNGHGTLYASLLAGRAPDATAEEDLVVGLADAADYFLIKARNANDRKTTVRNLLDALELAANLGAEIAISGHCIAASEMFFEDLGESEVERVFSLPGVQSMLLFAPLKNREKEDDWVGIVQDNIPSLRPEVINIAKFPANFSDVSGDIIGHNIPFLLDGFQGKVLAKNGAAIDMEFSNSGAVAIMGGIGILALSFFKSQNNGALPGRAGMLELLSACAQPISEGLAQPIIFKNF